MIEIVSILAIIVVIAGGMTALIADIRTLRRALRIGTIVVLAGLGLFLAARGLAVLDIPLGVVALLVLRGWAHRGFAGWERARDWVTGDGRIETPWLRGRVDPARNGFDALVLQGRFRGVWCHDLDDSQLAALVEECRADSESQRLVGRHREQRRRAGQPASGAMSREEAFQILGLEPGAPTEQVREAHRRLMAKVHPDQGGTNYLAQKLNLARDALLGKSP